MVTDVGFAGPSPALSAAKSLGYTVHKVQHGARVICTVFSWMGFSTFSGSYSQSGWDLGEAVKEGHDMFAHDIILTQQIGDDVDGARRAAMSP